MPHVHEGLDPLFRNEGVYGNPGEGWLFLAEGISPGFGNIRCKLSGWICIFLNRLYGFLRSEAAHPFPWAHIQTNRHGISDYSWIASVASYKRSHRELFVTGLYCLRHFITGAVDLFVPAG